MKMSSITPSQASKKLDIQPSTLRKYSLLLEKNGVVFARNPNNSRKYSEEDIMTLQKFITLMNNDGVTIEDASFAASIWHIGEADGVSYNDTDNVSQRNNDDMTLSLIAEIKGLKEKIEEQNITIDNFRKSQEKRDIQFVEILHDLDKKVSKINEKQILLPDVTEELKEVEVEQKKESKKGLFQRLFGK